MRKEGDSVGQREEEEKRKGMHIITQHTTQGICVPYVNILWHKLHH